MSAADNLSNLSNNSTDVYEDELSTWLQYPIDDERNYCSDLFVGWLPTPNTEVPKTVPDATPPAGSLSDAGTSTCKRSGSSRLPTKKNVGTKSFMRSSSNVEDALALGAARAAGRFSQSGLDAFNKVRTSMQPQAISLITTPCSSLKAFEHRNHSVKPTIPVPYTSKLPQGGAHSPRLQVAKTFSSERTKHAPSADISFATEKTRKTQETHGQQLSQTQQSRSSHITEEGRVCEMYASSSSSKAPLLGNAKVKGAMMTSSNSWDVNGKMGWADQSSETPHSHSGGSQTSMSLSFKEVTYGAKRKHEDSELQSEDADDNAMNLKVLRKSSSRRNRVSEVHNLSERNRRNRINDKLKTLQDLIPNSSKTDKASVLDEAIEYMKTLQTQLQMVSMRSSMNMSPMMMPMAFPQTPIHMAPLQSIGLGVPVGHAGMGMGFGMGMHMDMGLAQQSGRAAPFQSAPAAMTQYGMPFQSENMASLHDSSQACTNPSALMQKSRESSEKMRPRSLSTPYELQFQQPEQRQHFGYPSLNHEHEEQDDILD